MSTLRTRVRWTSDLSARISAAETRLTGVSRRLLVVSYGAGHDDDLVGIHPQLPKDPRHDDGAGALVVMRPMALPMSWV